MSLTYKVVSKLNPLNKTAPPKYYPQLTGKQTITHKRLAQQVAGMTSLSRVDVEAVLSALYDAVKEELTDGRVFEFGELGSFSLSIKGTGSENAADVTADKIESIRLSFRAKPAFREFLQSLPITKHQE